MAAIRGAAFTEVRSVAERAAQLQPGGELGAVAVTSTARKLD